MIDAQIANTGIGMFGLSLDRLFSIANTIYVLSVGVAAIATFAIYQLSTAISVRDVGEKEALRTQIEITKSDAAKANERAASLENEATKLRADNLALESQIAPRRLTQQQVNKLAKFFEANHGKEAVLSSYAMDLEAASLGEQIMQSARWANYQLVDRRMSLSSLGAIMWGVGVTGTDPDFVASIINTLNSFGLHASNQSPPAGAGMSLGADNSNASANIFIGVKPLPD